MAMAVALAQVERVPGSTWVLVLAMLGWALAVLLGAVALRSRGGARAPEPAVPAGTAPAAEAPEPRQLLQAVTPAETGIGGVLRWLHHATEATAVVLLEMVPGWGERLHTAPRGLPAPLVGSMTRLARDALLGGPTEGAEGTAVLRWLGVGASRVVVALDPATEDAPEAVRFGRYLIEWMVATGAEEPLPDLERRVRSIPGVAWAELDPLAGTLRVVLADGAGRAAVGSEVERELPSQDLQVGWIDVAPASSIGSEAVTAGTEARAPSPERLGEGQHDRQELRVRLVEVALTEDGQATADVRVRWGDHELRGRGHAHRTSSGPYLAGAKAVADALRPLLDSDVVVHGLYRAATEPDVQVLVAEVRLEGERLVGAVVDRDGEGHWTGARAVLDAVNRRLIQVAGRSGRL